MWNMSRAVRKAFLTGCCSLGFGLGFGQENGQENGQKKTLNVGHPVENSIKTEDMPATAVFLDGSPDGSYEQNIAFFTASYKFMTRQDIEQNIQLVLDYILQENFEPRIATPVVEMGDLPEDQYFYVEILPVSGNLEDSMGFDAEFAVMDAIEAGKEYIAAPVDEDYYAYNVNALYSLLLPITEFNRENKTDLGLSVPDIGGVAAFAIRAHEWSENQPRFGTVLLFGDLLYELDIAEVESVQYHELGHFAYELKDDQERQGYLDCILDKLGYAAHEIKELEPVGEEVFADLYAVRNMVEVYGEQAAKISKSALAKGMEDAIIEYYHHYYQENGLIPDDITSDNMHEAFKTATAEILRINDAHFRTEPTHPPILQRLHMMDRGADYYMKNKSCSCD